MSRKLLSRLPNTSSYAWKIYALRSKSSKTYALVPNLQWAQDLKDDLESLDPSLDVLLFPPLEDDLLRNRGPSNDSRNARLKFLCHCADDSSSGASVCVVPATALSQRCASLDFVRQHTLRIQKNSPLHLNEIKNFLLTAGYVPSEIVESPGQYAVRGSIIDLFSCTEDFPARIELWDDEVSEIRLFHPESQRKIADLEELLVGPAREFAFEENSGTNKKLRAIVREQKRPLEDREALIQRFKDQALFAEIDYWAPLLRNEDADTNSSLNHPILSFVKHFDFCVEAHTIEAQFLAQHSFTEKNFAEYSESHWVPPGESFLLDKVSTSESLRAHLARAKTWLAHKPQSGLAYEPEEKHELNISSLERLEEQLNQARVDALTPLKPLYEKITQLKEAGQSVYFFAQTNAQLERLDFLLKQQGYGPIKTAAFDFKSGGEWQVQLAQSSLAYGFEDFENKISFIPTESIFGTKHKPRRRKTGKNQRQSLLNSDLAFKNLQKNDIVIHSEHGIGRYLGLRVMSFQGIPTELIEVEYKDGNKLLVPVTKLNLIQKHTLSGESPALDKLGGQSWEKKKKSAKKELRSIAGDLLHLYSLRELAKGPAVSCEQSAVDEFAASFPYDETPDQESAIEACLKDVQSGKPMDRLLCGDVGYGKTEVALRVAHAVAHDGFQVALLAPTTILAVQHEKTFKKRLELFGLNVSGLSRFKTPEEKRQCLEGLRSGKINVVVGTHALLGNKVEFKNLGMLVVDEEQKFGVTHKEKIKQLRSNIHVLSMSATPIPRTLNMAMSGIKELSIISTPPAERVSVKTFIAKKNPELIREAVLREVKRGGQVFYVHNRVQSIQQEFEMLRELLPSVSVDYVHGQMEERQLEKRVFQFYEGKIQLLLTTAIVESGLDIPAANTLIVDRADTFGLSQLYQLRGRVGRSSERAYAYLMTPEKGKVTDVAEERLSVINNYQELGAGFHIASHDLDLRGAGDLLGRKQSGQISKLGFDTYVSLLKECIAELKGEHFEETIEPEIQIPLDTSIPESFIPDIGLRLLVYRRLSAALNEEEVDELAKELEDRFGHPPQSVENLYLLMRIKCQLRRLGIRAAVAGPKGVSLSPSSQTPISLDKMLESIKKYPSHFQLSPDGRIVIKNPANASETEDIVRSVEGALAQIESWTTHDS